MAIEFMPTIANGQDHRFHPSPSITPKKRASIRKHHPVLKMAQVGVQMRLTAGQMVQSQPSIVTGQRDVSDAIAAMRLIESAGLFEAEVWISPEQGRTGVTRLVSGGLRREFVRIPAGTADGTVLSAIGDPSARITIRFREETVDWTASAPNADAIQRFIADFAAPSPAARFARWARTPGNAA